MLTVLALTSGCASQDTACAACATGEARVGIATTTPAIGNDYPVTYRALVADNDRRARDVERVQVKSR
jgi:hypothetical protein